MVYLLVSLLGLAVGFAELYLLRRLIAALLASKVSSAMLLFPLKLLLLCAGLIPVLILAPGQLWLSGTCIAVPIIAGSFVIAASQRRKEVK